MKPKFLIPLVGSVKEKTYFAKKKMDKGIPIYLDDQNSTEEPATEHSDTGSSGESNHESTHEPTTPEEEPSPSESQGLF